MAEMQGGLAMATITTLGIAPAKRHSGVEVQIEVRTSTGRFTFPFEFEDQGSLVANEQQARRELRTFLQEALEALETQS